MPATHDGETPFTVTLGFDEEPALSYKTVEDSLLQVTGGTVTKASRVTQGSDSEWKVTVEPSQGYDITLKLPVRACGKTGAVCVDGRPLAQAASVTIPGEALTATLAGPAEHDGSESFTVRLTFSMEPDVSYKTVSDTMFTVTGGTITGAKRVKAPHDLEFDITVEPGGYEAVSLKLASPLPACGAAGAVCTAAGRKIEGTAGATIPGPVALSVADATVREGPGAMLEFAVTLDREHHADVTVDYATSNATATAGDDYVAQSGTLTFAAGETAKSVDVEVLDDVHDEGTETMTLTLSNPSGARIADGSATGRIENNDPMPKAWMVRFGRTVGSQVVDALNARLDGAGGSHVTVAGVNLVGAPGAEPQADNDDPFGLPEWAKNAGREADAQTITADDLLLRSAFHLSSGAQGAGAGPAFTAWGRVATAGFEATVDDVAMDGDVTTGLVGFDAEWERTLAGVMLSQSRGEGSYRLAPAKGADAGTVESSLTGVYPYARVDLGAKVSAWALAGIGSGELTLHRTGKKAMPTDLSMRMGALGVKGQVLDGTSASGLGVNVKTDAMWVGTKSARSKDMVGTEGDVTRLRLIVQGERIFEAGNGATFTPSAEVGLRHDGGDAETGTGVEVGGGLTLHPQVPLTIEGAGAHPRRARGQSGYEEWGMSGAIRVTPDAPRAGDLTLSHRSGHGAELGAPPSGYGPRKMQADSGSDNEFEGGQASSRWTQATESAFQATAACSHPMQDSRSARPGPARCAHGTRWQLGPDTVVGVEGTRQASDAGEGANEVRLRAALRF